MALTSPPECPANCFVEVSVSCSDITEGNIISPPSFILFFDANDWYIYQEVRIKGMDDTFPDGDQVYSIKVRVVSTNDPNYTRALSEMYQLPISIMNHLTIPLRKHS